MIRPLPLLNLAIRYVKLSNINLQSKRKLNSFTTQSSTIWEFLTDVPKYTDQPTHMLENHMGPRW